LYSKLPVVPFNAHFCVGWHYHILAVFYILLVSDAQSSLMTCPDWCVCW